MITKPLVKMRPEIGWAYLAVTGHRELSSHDRPSSAVVLEDGVSLPGPGNALHNDIRRFGAGRYSFWHNRVYFSTTDNSDPRVNGRQYAIAYTRKSGNRLTASLPHFKYPSVAQTVKNATSRFGVEQRRQALWGALYWLCFAYVLWCRGRLYRFRLVSPSLPR